MKRFVLAAVLVVCTLGVNYVSAADDKKSGKQAQAKPAQSKPAAAVKSDDKVVQDAKTMPDSYWKKKLAPDVYQVTRCSATEPAFTGKYWDNHKPGAYNCSNCGKPLFDSKDKFDSGTGWPSFTQPVDKANVASKVDRSFGSVREEVVCKHCGAHLGHVFDDGPKPTGQRFCINSASLDFNERNESKTTTPAHK